MRKADRSRVQQGLHRDILRSRYSAELRPVAVNAGGENAVGYAHNTHDEPCDEIILDVAFEAEVEQTVIPALVGDDACEDICETGA